MDVDDERNTLARMLRQKLEGLARAGVDRIPGPRGWVEPPILASQPLAAPVKPLKVEKASPPMNEKPADPPPSPRPAFAPPLPSSLFEEPILDPFVPESERGAQLAALSAKVSRCIRCPHLASTRTKTVFGEGPTAPRLMFIGEAPGADEDSSGRPFVGRAGALLTDMITKGMGLRREDVYIANILKSRPPDNRTPLPEEMANCLPYLEQQIAILRPEFLCLLGKTAASALLDTALPLGRLRGKWYRYRGIATIVTYHPSALLRNPAWKRDAWSDLQILMNAMGLKTPEKKRPG